MFSYVLRDEAGIELERSTDKAPMVYLHGGYRNVLPSLELALDGAETGQELTVTLPPEQAYGLRTGEPQRVPIKHLLSPEKRLKPGMVVRVNTKDGPREVVIVKVGKFNVDVDTNHPLAGKTVTFEITVKDVRPATADEIEDRTAKNPHE